MERIVNKKAKQLISNWQQDGPGFFLKIYVYIYPAVSVQEFSFYSVSEPILEQFSYNKKQLTGS